jgi:hypothetical protein
MKYQERVHEILENVWKKDNIVILTREDWEDLLEIIAINFEELKQDIKRKFNVMPKRRLVLSTPRRKEK